LKHSLATKQDNGNAITKLFASQGRLHPIKHYLRLRSIIVEFDFFFFG